MFSMRLRRNLSRRCPAASSVTLNSSFKDPPGSSFRLHLGKVGHAPGAIGFLREAKMGQPLQFAAALRAEVQFVGGLAASALAGERLARIVDAHLPQLHPALPAARFGGERELFLEPHLRNAGGERERGVLIGLDVVLVDELVGDAGRIGHAAAGEKQGRAGGGVEALAVHLESILSAGRRGSLAKIYTRRGDDGSTGLFGGPRVRKDDLRVAAYGDVDELNSALGVAREEILQAPDLLALVDALQSELFTLGAELATPDAAQAPKEVPRITPAQVTRLEQEIDRLTAGLPEMENFILPGGARSGAALHLCRTACRRAV